CNGRLTEYLELYSNYLLSTLQNNADENEEEKGFP
ncbi:MAG: hypothetical protein RL713_1571, partial [Bacteroidota bacterium]